MMQPREGREPSPPEDAAQRVGDVPLRTLVVDDDPTSREMLGKVLRCAGHVAILAASAEEGLDLFHQQAPDMVLMDIMLPGMNGLEAMRRMKLSCGERWLPVILISVMDTPEEVLVGLRSGADDYLTKPIRVDHVLAKLRNTARTLLLQAQLSSALRFGRAIMEHIHEAIVCCDAQGAIHSANRSAELLFDGAPGSLTGRAVAELIVDDGLQEGLRAKRHGAYYATGKRSDGELFSLEVRHTLVTVDMRVVTVLTLRDVSRQLSDERRMLNDAAQLREYKASHEAENALAREMLTKLLHQGGYQTDALRYYSQAATGFSGDVVVSLRSPSGKVFVVLADATGHGLAAAISLVPALSVLHAMVARDRSLSEIVDELNTKMLALMPVGRFLAGCIVCLDLSGRRGEIWVGGMPSVLMVAPSGSLLRQFESSHLAFGIVPTDPSMREVVNFSWDAPCQLILMSDGVLEAESVAGEPWGEQGLHAVLTKAAPADRLEAVREGLAAHLNGLPANDDASVAIVDLP